jgi:predicted DNA-binding WGR domain protein
MQFEIFPDQMGLRCEDAYRNMRRFYRMVVQRDLFGGASLIREWGRIGMAGRVRIDHHLDEGRAVDALAELVAIKRKRGDRRAGARVSIASVKNVHEPDYAGSSEPP